MILKNRKIYGITANQSISDLYINFGESRYGYVSLQKFIENFKTFKFNPTDKTNGWIKLTDCIKLKLLPKSFYFDEVTLNFMELLLKYNFVKVDNKIVYFNEGMYLFEVNKFITFKDSNQFIKINEYKNYTLKVRKNGQDSIVVFKGRKKLHSNISSINFAKELINNLAS